METFIHDKLHDDQDHDDQDHDDIDAVEVNAHVAHANVAHVAPGGLCLDDTTSLDALVSQVCALNSIVDKIKMSIADTLDIMFTQKKTCGDVLNDRIISRVQDLHEDVITIKMREALSLLIFSSHNTRTTSPIRNSFVGLEFSMPTKAQSA